MTTTPVEAAEKRNYFPNLNGLRFIAAYLVFIHHSEQYKDLLHMPSYWNYQQVQIIGHLGVVLFFVMSGFLITYQLQSEKVETQTINVTGFYIRRLARIWPLYYLVVFLSIFVFPHFSLTYVPYFSEKIQEHLGPRLVLFGLFLPQVESSLYELVPFASQTWSLGAEEQFYLVWPWLVKKCSNIERVIYIVIAFYVCVRYLFAHCFSNVFTESFVTALQAVWQSTPIQCMAIGGLAACQLRGQNASFLKFIFSRKVQILTYVAIALLVEQGVPPAANFEVYSLLFAVTVLNLSSNPNSLISWERNRSLSYLGKISYGIYMYQGVCIFATLKILKNSTLLYPVSSLAVIVVSALSYEFFEKRIIRASRVAMSPRIAEPQKSSRERASLLQAEFTISEPLLDRKERSLESPR